MKNIKLFVTGIKKKDYSNLFLNSLIDDYCEEFKILFNYNKSLNVINKNNTKAKQNM
jgi:hypothetical protein